MLSGVVIREKGDATVPVLYEGAVTKVSKSGNPKVRHPSRLSPHILYGIACRPLPYDWQAMNRTRFCINLAFLAMLHVGPLPSRTRTGESH